jgi:protein-S-isoprenylcysteine O-methyltransferase Ste14
VARRVPFRLGRDLATTTYAMGASLQLLVVFGLWSPSGILWWEPAGAPGGVFDLAFAASWLLLAKAMGDAGLGIQSGSQGWLAVARGLRPRYGPFPQHGLFRWCRQPVYLAFALTLWTGPVWTPDHLVIAAVWTAYCVLGARIKERRYLAAFGDEFRAYQRRVGFWWPAASTEPPRG